MLSFVQLDKPHIDIELYGTDTNIAPIDKVHIMDEDSFEQFTLEWLFGCKKSKYSSIKRIGGAGDKGRDVVGYYSDGTVDYYQCKHYNTGLAPTNYYLELGKLCYYTYKKEIPMPKEYFIIASNDVGSSLQDLIDKPSDLLTSLIKNWDTYCKTKITKTKEVPLDKSFLDYIKSFDFTIIKTYPIAQVIDEYLDTIYGNIRFGGRRLSLPTTLTPTDTVESEEMPYISALLEAYSDELNIKIDTIKSLDYVVIILIVSAGLLAFVVLYNLSNVNISERIRELATIKVLGFYDKEVYSYVNRETVLLTMIGIVLGLIGGYFLNYYILGTCEINALRFTKTINPISYVYATLITVVFTFIVNIATYFALKKIDMITSLKSVE